MGGLWGGITHVWHQAGNTIAHVANGGLITDVAHATMDPKTARKVDESVHKLTSAENKALSDVGNTLKDSAVHCARNPGECALAAVDYVPFVGTAVRCTQWGVEAAQGHNDSDGPTNCLMNLASDAVPVYGKFARAGGAAVKFGINSAKASRAAGSAAAAARRAAAARKAAQKSAEIQRRLRQAEIRKELAQMAKKEAKDLSTELATSAAIGAIEDSLYDDDYEPSPEEEAFDDKSFEQPAPPNTLAVAVGVVAFAAIVYVAYEKF